MRSRSLYDAAAVLARIGIGVVFMAHGWQKIEAGVTATGESFDALGVPLPTVAAVYSAFIELLGGAALIAGLGLPVTGALLFIDMVGALVFVHAGKGLFMVDGDTVTNGWELVVALGMASLLFAAGGGGRLTADQWITRKRGRHSGGERREDDDGDVQDFVQSLRQAEARPADDPAKAPPSARTAEIPAPAPPEPTGSPPAPGTGTGTEDDKPVAGRRKPTQRRRTSGTKSAKPPGNDDGTDPT